MAATCAACNGPIANGERFVLSGTEVFHRNAACVRDMARSALNRAKAEAASTRIELERAQREAMSLRRDLADTKLVADDLRAELDGTKKLLRRAEEGRLADHRRASEERRLAETAERQLDSLRGQFRQSQNDLAAARAEIAKLQADAIRRATDDLPVPPKVDTRDDTEIRFSLLEIDPP